MKMTLKDNVLYTDNEAAKILGVPVETIKEWRYFGLGGLEGSGKNLNAPCYILTIPII